MNWHEADQLVARYDATAFEMRKIIRKVVDESQTGAEVNQRLDADAEYCALLKEHVALQMRFCRALQAYDSVSV